MGEIGYIKSTGAFYSVLGAVDLYTSYNTEDPKTKNALYKEGLIKITFGMGCLVVGAIIYEVRPGQVLDDLAALGKILKPINLVVGGSIFMRWGVEHLLEAQHQPDKINNIEFQEGIKQMACGVAALGLAALASG